GFANRQGDGTLVRIGRDGTEQCAEFLERVGLKLLQSVIHVQFVLKAGRPHFVAEVAKRR
nr:hypothetical protein [Tanacetum cinerariifolium]